MKVLARTVISSEAGLWGNLLQNSRGCWQRSMSCGCRTAGLLGFGQGCPQLLKAALNVLPHGPPNMTSRCVNAGKRERCLETWVVPSCVITYTKSLHAATLPYSVWLEATYEASLDSRAGNHSRACTQKGRSEGVHPRRLSAMYDVQ